MKRVRGRRWMTLTKRWLLVNWPSIFWIKDHISVYQSTGKESSFVSSVDCTRNKRKGSKRPGIVSAAVFLGSLSHRENHKRNSAPECESPRPLLTLACDSLDGRQNAGLCVGDLERPGVHKKLIKELLLMYQTQLTLRFCEGNLLHLQSWKCCSTLIGDERDD